MTYSTISGPVGLPLRAPESSDAFEPAFPFIDIFENLAILVRKFVLPFCIYVSNLR